MKNTLAITLVCIFILSGCASERSKGPGDKYIKQISSSIKKDYNIPSGELIAKYNLLGKSSQGVCLFAKDYGTIVSDNIATQKFLYSVQKLLKNPGILHSSSKAKIVGLYTRIVDINTKYNIIANYELRKIQKLVPTSKQNYTSSPFDLIDELPQTMSANHFASLALIDRVIKHIPVFLPQTHTLMTSSFGNRKHPIFKERKFHQGTDFVSSKHAMIHAAADGKVIEVARSPSYGNFILIEHSKILKTRYAHLSKIYSTQGSRVFQGEAIGHQGNTGHSTAEHLHFEVVYKENPIDPMIFVGHEYNCKKNNKKG